MPIEKFSTIKPAPGQGKRVMKAKLLTALGATGPDRPYTANPEHILESKILLQNTFNPNPVTPPTPPPATNGLLNNLTSYWKFDVDSSPYADSIGGNPLTGHGTNASVPGIINTGLNVGLGGSFADAANVAGGDFDPANTSFSLSLWVSSSNWSQAGAPFYIVLNNGNPGSSIATGPYYLFIDHALQQLICGMFDSGVNQFQQVVQGAFPTNNVFHHIVLSFDAAAKTFKSYYDGSLAVSSNTTTGGLYQGAGGSFVLSTTALPTFIIDEVGMWHKSLTATDVTTLYNAGAGLPLASFQT